MKVIEQITFETREPVEAIRESKRKIFEDYGISVMPLVQQLIDIGEGCFLVIINITDNS
ncbi:hypothetical protein [Bacillus sp. 7884-1]|uniref:hypothetical protein n=1 Tax=Bacillus sp. 7884-1 TaxID=2021693 RepID=UPI0015CC1CBB|nr:hypothetical protein [Bacillus sp. 7884-1]